MLWLVALCTGAAVAFFAGNYWRAVETPRTPSVAGIRVQPVGDEGWHRLLVALTLPRSPACERERQDLLILSRRPMIHYPLGSARGGDGFNTVAGRVVEAYDLPPWIKGDLEFETRVTVACRVAFGLTFVRDEPPQRLRVRVP